MNTSPQKKPTPLNKVSRLIDCKGGFYSALITSSIVFTVNILATDPHDWLGSTTASLKQAVYTFFMGGSLIKLASWLATRTDNKFIAYSTSILLPSGLASVLVFFLHSMRGTPEPVLSTIPIAIISFTIAPFLAVRARKNQPVQPS